MRPKTAAEIAIMREGGRRLAAILNKLAEEVKPGLSGKDISAIAAKEIKAAGLQPVVLGYQGFPDVMCVSVNQTIVHGTPDDKPFKEGDIVKLDLTLGYKSLVIDSALTVVAGVKKPTGDTARLIDGTKQALYAGIDAIKGEGTHIGDIGAAVQKVLNRHKLGIIRELVGHGLGDKIHEEPNVPNYGAKGSGPGLRAGMTIAVEPMASLGDWPVHILEDGTVTMKDDSWGAHFEHTVLITDKGAEILTTL